MGISVQGLVLVGAMVAGVALLGEGRKAATTYGAQGRVERTSTVSHDCTREAEFSRLRADPSEV
ncbi:hypothetical protein GTZ99_03925 [Novosphingobium sp. FSY-8]|uniref:Uncharacterized protein n=1 Tax=Novosphingobium ovatum TaxID=1908523 RepID=A0ABW9XB01_9SPHN|nr:hypothetical protein [Novosphingobium ovatum]NBC35701.1 hypothetical protein [Novosphingobium ovatum]